MAEEIQGIEKLAAAWLEAERLAIETDNSARFEERARTLSDLYDRGLQDDVAVVMWGEFGRAPRISRIAGRDHWPEAGAAVVAGGGFKVGQVIGETDAQGARSKVKPYTPSNILANLYQHLGIDPAAAIPGFDGRPMHILDDREPVRELIA